MELTAVDHMDVRATAQSHAPEAVRHDSFSTGVLHHIAGRVTRATSHVSLHCVCRGLSLSLCVCVCVFSPVYNYSAYKLLL